MPHLDIFEVVLMLLIIVIEKIQEIWTHLLLLSHY